MHERTPIDEDAIAEALGDLASRRARGEEPSVLEYRDRLGDSHSAFLEVLETEAVLDEVLDPPAEEGFPREFGPFTLIRELGHGAMGVVYEGVHRQIGRHAAVKVIRRGFDLDVQARERFRRETRALAQIRHPHVVEIHEAGEIEGRPFFAMGLVEGRSLSALVKSGAVPAPHDLARSMAGIADALGALHAAGVVHRDVKPSNVMVRSDGHFLLADFGHARVGDGLGLTATGETLGTPLYMSPEQVIDAKSGVDARSDVYALGATLYEALAGRPVFQATDYPTLTRKILEERPEPLHKVASGVPLKLEAIVMKALEKRPDDRYASAAAMANDLRAFADGRHVEGKPVGAIVHFARFLRKRAVPIAAALAVVLGAGWWFTHRPATFRIVSLPPGAEVFVAGTSKGTAPLEVSLSPGAYDVTLRMTGFADTNRRYEFASGSRNVAELPLAVETRGDGTDFGARDRALGAVGVEIARLTPPSGTRAASDGFTVLWPRGDVRVEDLVDWAAEAPYYPAGSVVELVRGTSEVLHSEKLEADGSLRRPIPAHVRGLVKEGDALRFGLRLPGKKPGELGRSPTSATVRVVGPKAGEHIDGAEERLGEQPAAFGAEVRLRLLVAAGLRTAALREVEDLPADVRGDPRVLALTQRLYEEVNLGETRRGVEVKGRIDALPAEVYRRVYGEDRPK